MAFNILPTGMSFQRLGKFPLDSSSLYNTLAEAMDYVQNNPTAYPGQVIYVADARTEEEIINNADPHEAMFMITAEKQIKLVVSEDDLNMDEMVQEVEEEVKQLQDNLDMAVENINKAMEEKANADEVKNKEQDDALQAHVEEANAKFAEMEQAAANKHAEIEEAVANMKAEMEAKHEAMEQAADAKHTEMEKAMADMQAAAKAKHAEMEENMAAEYQAMREEAQAIHKEMQAEADAEHEAVRELMDIQKPYMADLAAYPTSKFLFACGNPMTVEPNVGQKYDAEKPEDAVAFVYRWAEGFEAIVVE